MHKSHRFNTKRVLVSHLPSVASHIQSRKVIGEASTEVDDVHQVSRDMNN